ncbi:MAG: hypothetical protein JXB14_04100 [Candidatus Altiarchaeota archaeon]|nr:hypothetical protein [Candidatus Altiarchaeota archaeon]
MQYRRKLTETEAQGDFILILKEYLRKFPPENEEFELEVGGRKIKTKVEGIYCECAGPENPHYHYHLWVGDVKLKKGDNILIISKDSKTGEPKSGFKLYFRP